MDEIRHYVEGVANNLVDKLDGPSGPAWGTTLTDIESLLLDIRQVLTEKMLDAALAGRNFAAGWGCYPEWIGWVWPGQVSAVIAALEVRPSELGVPGADAAETSPAAVVSKMSF